MNRKYIIKVLSNAAAASFAVVSAVSCVESHRVYEADVVGVKDAEIVVEAAAGLQEVIFYANRPGRINMLDGSEWASIDRTVFDANGTFNVEYDGNEGYPRMAEIELALDDYPWRDTVKIKQKGRLSDEYSLPNTNVVVYNVSGTGTTLVKIDTELPDDVFGLSVRYLSDASQPWITSASVTDGNVRIETTDNTDAVNTRSAVITLSYHSGWGELVTTELYVTQANSSNNLGEDVTIADLKSMASEDGENILDDYILEGYVVSDASTLNAGDNPLKTSTSIDYEACEKTVYVESMDGTAGVMIETASVEDNVFRNDTHVKIKLKGARAFRYSEPDRLVLEGVTSSMLVESESVDKSVIPEKRKKVGELTDNDVYTRVVLTDVELPVRKGGLTPIHDGYTNSAGAHRISKFPLLVRCKDGESLYMFTNTTCPYRRNGTKPGDGSGTIEGVIVHELYRPFQEADNAVEELCGNIGRYQIRHFAYEDIALAKSFDDSFSGLIAEWRYIVDGSNGWMPATKGEGQITHTYEDYMSTSRQIRMYTAVNDWSYLGPCGTDDKFPFGKNLGNVNGLGIYLDDGTDYGAGDTGINTDGKGGGQGKGYGWASDYWWDTANNAPYYWLIKFSTKDIVTDCLSMQVSMLNMSQSAMTPHNWKLEYSTTGNDDDWTEHSTFTVPDLVLWDMTLASQSAGAKGMDFKLPLELLGKEAVYVRIGPADRSASDKLGYANAVYSNVEKRRSCMNYCAIRYNK